MENFRFAPNGIAPDAVPESMPDTFWTVSNNVMSRDGMERAGGVAEMFGTPLFPPRWLLWTKSTVSPSFWIYCADAGIGGTDGTHTDLTPTAGFVANAGANVWTGGNLNGLPVVGNGHIPLWWDQSIATNFQVVPGWPASNRAKAVRPYQFHLIAMNVDPGTGKFNQDLILWSTAAVPGAVPSTWVPGPANEAGSAQLSATGGAILDGVALRSSFVIYKTTSCYTMRYVGGANVMQVQQLFSDVGLIAANCAVEKDGFHVVLAEGDIILHDGNTAKSIADGYIRETFLRNLDAQTQGRCFVVPHTPPGEVWIAFPEPGQTGCTKAAVWDMSRSRWGVRDLAMIRPTHIAQGVVPYQLGLGGLRWVDQVGTWEEQVRSWDYSGPRTDPYGLLAAGSVDDGATAFALVPGLYALEVPLDTLGLPTRGVLVREALDFGEPDAVKTVNRCWVKAKGPVGTRFAVEMGGRLNVGDPVTYGAPVYVTIGGRMDAPIFANGRYLSLRISDASSAILDIWKVTQVTFDYTSKGGF